MHGAQIGGMYGAQVSLMHGALGVHSYIGFIREDAHSKQFSSCIIRGVRR